MKNFQKFIVKHKFPAFSLWMQGIFVYKSISSALKALIKNFINCKEIEYRLKDTQTDKEKPLGKVLWSRNSGAGFFQNGDVYIFDEFSGLKIYDTDMNNADAIFNSQINFPCGKNIDGNGTERYIFAIRRDPKNLDYIVIYGEYSDNNSLQSYRIGLLDKAGRLMHTYQLPVQFDKRDFYEVHMFKSGDTEIEFYAQMKDNELFRARFDYAVEKFIKIK